MVRSCGGVCGVRGSCAGDCGAEVPYPVWGDREEPCGRVMWVVCRGSAGGTGCYRGGSSNLGGEGCSRGFVALAGDLPVNKLVVR